MNLNKYVLDSSAVLAVFKQEPGADQVRDLLEQSVISAVNLSECIAKITLNSIPEAPHGQALKILKDMLPEVIAFDQTLAAIAGELAATSQSFGLSPGDRACLATAIHLDLEAVTANKIWANLNVPVKIKFIR